MARVEVIDGARTRDLRRAVLRPHLRPGDPLPGDDLPTGVHLGAVDPDGTVACTCFVYPHPCAWQPGRPAWRLRQMATLPQRRGEGLGAAVVAAALAHVERAGAEVLWCDARESAAGFYTALGFLTHGDAFVDESHPIPHLRMWRELPAAPTSSQR